MRKAQKQAQPRKVTPKVFMWVKKLYERNPKITSEGLAKMIKGRVGRSTIDLITKCHDYKAYVFLLGKLQEIERLRSECSSRAERKVVLSEFVSAQLAAHRWKARALLLALLSLGFAAIALSLLLWRN